MKHCHLNTLWILALLLFTGTEAAAQFTFAVLSDQRWYSGADTFNRSSYFRGALEAAQRSAAIDFLVIPGDLDPPASTAWSIEQVFGSGFPWYPVVGNHELPGEGNEPYPGANMEWLRAFDNDWNGSNLQPDPVRTGPPGCPETTYAFDHANAHFVVLNEYCAAGGDTVTQGDISDHLYTWLAEDLEATDREHIFVIGHEPAFPQPDVDNGRFRHWDDSLNQFPASRNRLWSLLKAAGVRAYFCGHTHDFSVLQIDGIWQLDSGHARGAGDTGAPSTLVLVHVDNQTITYTVRREAHDGIYDYQDIVHEGTLAGTRQLRSRSFQDDLAPYSGYAGTRDTYLAASAPNTNFGGAATLHADTDEPAATGKIDASLLYWDIRAIPAGSEVREATIDLWVTDASQGCFEIYAVERPWKETEATWNGPAAGLSWQLPGAGGSGDRGAVLLGAYSPGRSGRLSLPLNRQGIAAVQAWIDNPDGNHGLLVSSTSTDGFDWSSRESTAADTRPKLTIRYAARNGPAGSVRALPWNLLLLRR